MRIYSIMLILTMVSFQTQAKELGAKDINLMGNIVNNCLKISPLKFPRPDVKMDRKLQDFNDHKGWFIRDMKDLSSLNNDAINSKHVIKGKPFNEHVSDCKKLISTTESKLAEKISINTNKDLKTTKAEELGIKDIRSMNDIVKNCLKIPHLKFPRPEVAVDRELQSFNDHKGWFIRDMKNLESRNPNALNSGHAIKGKPFVEHISECRNTISSIDDKLNNSISEKPSEAAQEKINNALLQCSIANTLIDNKEIQGTEYDLIPPYYDKYINGVKEAKLLDSRVASWKGPQISLCNKILVPKFLAMKKENEAKIAAHLAAKEAKRLEREQKEAAELIVRQQEEKEAAVARKAKAKSLGYKDLYPGISSALNTLNNGHSSLKDLKQYLITHSGSEKFVVVSIVGNYVIYGLNRQKSQFEYEYIQVAVIKQSKGFYGDGASLPNSFYAIKGMKDFSSVLGVTKQLLILKEISE